jgi:hypothetical protein
VKHQQQVALLDAVDLAVDKREVVEEELVVVVMEMNARVNAMAGGAQEMEARVRVMEYVVEMGVEEAIAIEEAMTVVLAPALSLHRLQHCHPHADSLLEEHDACIPQSLRCV